VALKESDKKHPHLLGRRDALSIGALGGVGLCLGGAILVGARTLWPRAGRASALRLAAGRPADYAVGQVDGRLLREHGVWVVRDTKGFYALSARCTHLGCRLRHVPSTDRARFHCMCHGSLFSLEGEVLRGPASRHLERVYLAQATDGTLLVDPALRYRQELGEWQRPGAFVRLPPAKRSTR
jgi:cytochrome b6-f complex iron-sulfur subunit